MNVLAADVAKKLGYEIYSLSLIGNKKRSLTVVIDRRDGYVSIDDCQKFSREFERVLDNVDFMEFSYDLIVESPGVERELRTIEEFRRFEGEFVKVILKEPLEGKTDVIGKVRVSEDGEIIVVNKNTGIELRIGFDNIKHAKLKLEF